MVAECRGWLLAQGGAVCSFSSGSGPMDKGTRSSERRRCTADLFCRLHVIDQNRNCQNVPVQYGWIGSPQWTTAANLCR
eukprot:3033629-Rhodomonas_salina.1